METTVGRSFETDEARHALLTKAAEAAIRAALDSPRGRAFLHNPELRTLDEDVHDAASDFVRKADRLRDEASNAIRSLERAVASVNGYEGINGLGVLQSQGVKVDVAAAVCDEAGRALQAAIWRASRRYF